MKKIFLSTLLVLTIVLKGQNSIEWSKDYQLQLSDFQSPSTEIGNSNIYSLHTAAGLDFSFYMSNAEFMFTKNFNSKVNCIFNRTAASLVAPDSIYALDLLSFARYEFDLSELYARKLRKKLYEEKDAFSDVNFFRPVYDQIQRELTERHTYSGKITELGRNGEKLSELHNEVLQEIEQLSEFCKQCKPIKKKK